MSLPLYGVGGLRFWSQREINARERMTQQIYQEISSSLLELNQGWVFERVDCPVIMPRDRMNADYSDDDVFALQAQIGARNMALRAETTDGSYAMVQHFLQRGVKPPLGVWQLGQSFRRETNDGASASKLRFNAFYQLEFQLVYAKSTGADYAGMLRDRLTKLVARMLHCEARLEPSDRIPQYSDETIDIEVNVGSDDRETIWREVASTSRRNDLPEFANYEKGGKRELTVFEVALGMDRLVAIALENEK